MNEFLKEKYNDLQRDGAIKPELYDIYKVKKGLRNNNGTGVLVGLTKVSDVSGYTVVDGEKIPKVGNLYYRGIDIREVAKMTGNGFGYEKVCFLLLFGHYPSDEETEKFCEIIKSGYDLPVGFLENIILPHTSKSLMNHMARSILSLYSFDDDPDNISPETLIEKGVSLISKIPAIAAYCLQAKTHYLDNDSLHIHFPKAEYSFAENLLYLSRNDGIFTDLEAKTLDMVLAVHADHGGGNNGTFVGSVVSSTHTDIYSMLSASMASLKGPRHGGASISVQEMMKCVINDIGVNATDDQINDVIDKILNKEYFDNSGLIYGLGHAVYTLSDPRCEILKESAKKLAREKRKFRDKYKFYTRFEELALKKLEEKRGQKTCANVDFYSGFIYEMLNIPHDLYTPMFAVARMVGWIAHDIETLMYSDKLVRPATRYVGFE